MYENSLDDFQQKFNGRIIKTVDSIPGEFVGIQLCFFTHTDIEHYFCILQDGREHKKPIKNLDVDWMLANNNEDMVKDFFLLSIK